MKYILRVPTKEQYAYIEAEFEGEPDRPEDAVAVYNWLTREVHGSTGVGMKKLAQIIHEYCTTGKIVDGHEYEFSTNESLLVNEIKKILRK